jgi:DNA-binding beta-propeller fold protein YncE
VTHKILAYAVVVASLVFAGMNLSIESQTIDSSAPVRASGVPLFELDQSWPKVPQRWKLGQVSSVSIDAKDHVWLLQRPRSLGADQQGMAAPPVLEFDAAGNYVQGWGGPADQYEWPEREHGFHVDHKGNVWITGTWCPARKGPGLKAVSDDQILKFTGSGKFLKQIGHSSQSGGNSDTKNFHQPADVFVDPKTNELFVADGYGNHRVIVMDADTGAFKRMWGAFGNKPIDSVRCPPGAPKPPIPDDGGGQPGPQQFFSVFGARVSNDGLVYVADREHKRIQVFTTAGKYVTQVFVGRRGGIAFSPDPDQTFLYVGGDKKVLVLNRKALAVLDEFEGSDPHALAVDSKGNLYSASVTDGGGIQKFVFKGFATGRSQ